MNKMDIEELFEYNQWAKRRLLESLKDIKDDDLARDLHSSHGGIGGTLTHMIAAEKIWTNRLTGEPPVGLDQSQLKSLADYIRVWDEIDAKFSAYLSKVTDEQLASNLEYSDSKGNKYSHPRLWAINQLFNHLTYHRGQIVTLQRQLGYKPANTDLIGFYRQKK